MMVSRPVDARFSIGKRFGEWGPLWNYYMDEYGRLVKGKIPRDSKRIPRETLLAYPISQFFGTHTGIDMIGDKDNPIKDAQVMAVETGLVEYAKTTDIDGGWGKYIREKFLVDGVPFYAYYCHLAEIFFKTGQPIMKNEIIALVGNTGNATGYHLHFELRDKEGRPIEPVFYNV